MNRDLAICREFTIHDMSPSARPRHPHSILTSYTDITERKQAEEALAQSHAQLKAHAEEFTRFNGAGVRHELRMIEMKKEINALHQRHGEPASYPREFDTEGKNETG